MATDEERRALEEQYRIMGLRLNRLKIQQARYGYSADPAVENEIADIEFSMETLKRHMEGPQLLPAAREAIERFQADNIAFLMSTAANTTERLTKVEQRVDTLGAQNHAAAEWRLAKGAAIEELQQRAAKEEREAPAGRKRNFRLLLANVVLLLLILGGLIYFAGSR